jgi:hypothetical protein
MSALDVLNNAQYISLKTFRKSGQAVPTPVWFACEGDRLYIVTQADAGKVKRIRNNGQVEVAPCDARGNLKGDYVAAQARELPSAEHSRANDALNRKYGLIKRLFDLMQRGRARTYLEVWV